MSSDSPLTIDFSTLESDIIGLKIGRCNQDLFDEKKLYDGITAGHYDLCRIKVVAEDEFVVRRLHQTGLPYFFSGSIRRYSTHFDDKTQIEFKHADLSFEAYDGSQEDLLREMFVDTWGVYPIGYYRTPFTDSLVTKEQEIDCVFQYYKKYNFNADYPGNKIMFIRDGGKPVGFFTLNKVDKNLECNLGGILQPYRRDHYFWDVMNYNKQLCIKDNIEFFTLGARNENASAQRLFQNLGFKPIGCDNVFHIPSMLTFTQLPLIVKEINTHGLNTHALYQHLLSAVSPIVESVLPCKTITSFHLNKLDALLTGKSAKIRFSFPVHTDDESLIVIRSEDNNASGFTGYVRAIRS